MVGDEGVEEARPTLDVELAFDEDDVVDIAPDRDWLKRRDRLDRTILSAKNIPNGLLPLFS